MIRRSLVVFALLTLPALFAVGGAPRPVAFRTQTMGTWATLTIVTPDSAAVADLAYRSLLELHRVDSLMSNWTQTSEIARINREAGKSNVVVHPEVATVLDFAQRVTRATDGAMDITVEPLVRAWGFLGGERHVPTQAEITQALQSVGPDKLRFDAANKTIRFTNAHTRIDLGGIAKGYGVDRVADMVRRAGITGALVDLSGNMRALGDAAGKSGWSVGIRDPSGKHPYLATIRLHDDAISTSGNYEQFVDANGKRYGHIIDPRTGWPADGLVSVTVVASTAMECDAWDTGLFVLGSEKARAIAKSHSEFAVVIVEPARTGYIVWVEESLRPRFHVESGSVSSITIRYF
jgi:thiamine biosynthesis lipoprotein